MITRVSESPVFKWAGENLEVEVPLTIPEAITGAVIEVPTLTGTKRLRVPRGTKHGTVQRLRGEGPPRLGGKGNGDLHYRFVIDVPSTLSAEQTDAVEKLSEVIDGNPRAKLFAEAARCMMERQGAGPTHDHDRVEVVLGPWCVHDLGRGRARRMHPQTLRMYEARGLIEPKRSPKGTRLYSHRDVERLRRIQEMTAELGMNLAGVERVFELETQLASMTRKVSALERRAAGAEGSRSSGSRRCGASCAPRSCPTPAAARSCAARTSSGS